MGEAWGVFHGQWCIRERVDPMVKVKHYELRERLEPTHGAVDRGGVQGGSPIGGNVQGVAFVGAEL